MRVFGMRFKQVIREAHLLYVRRDILNRDLMLGSLDLCGIRIIRLALDLNGNIFITLRFRVAPVEPVLFLFIFSDPWMHHDLTYGYPLQRVLAKHLTDQILTWR